MNDQNCITSACRYCRFYKPEGMHGGACEQLNVSVRSDWKACQLGLPAFSNDWDAERLAIVNRQVDLVQVPERQGMAGIVSLELSNTRPSNNNCLHCSELGICTVMLKSSDRIARVESSLRSMAGSDHFQQTESGTFPS